MSLRVLISLRRRMDLLELISFNLLVYNMLMLYHGSSGGQRIAGYFLTMLWTDEIRTSRKLYWTSRLLLLPSRDLLVTLSY